MSVFATVRIDSKMSSIFSSRPIIWRNRWNDGDCSPSDDPCRSATNSRTSRASTLSAGTLAV